MMPGDFERYTLDRDEVAIIEEWRKYKTTPFLEMKLLKRNGALYRIPVTLDKIIEKK